MPITLARISNQIVCVCSWLVNFQSVLIPPKGTTDDEDSDDVEDVEEYFKSYYETESDYDADTEASDIEMP